MNTPPLPFSCFTENSFLWQTIVYFAFVLAPSIAYAAPVPQQMELRQFEEYSGENFKKSKPAVGSLAPNMELKTLDGKTVSLDSYRGKNIVVIKAGYT